MISRAIWADRPGRSDTLEAPIGGRGRDTGPGLIVLAILLTGAAFDGQLDPVGQVVGVHLFQEVAVDAGLVSLTALIWEMPPRVQKVMLMAGRLGKK